MYRPVQCYLWIYLSVQNDRSSTSLFWNPAYFAVVAFLLHGYADLSAVLTHYLVVFKLVCWNWNWESDLPSLPALCLQELVALPATEQFKPDQTDHWNLLKWKVRHKMKFTLSHPSFCLKKEVKCVITDSWGPILSPSAFLEVAPWLAIE